MGLRDFIKGVFGKASPAEESRTGAPALEEPCWKAINRKKCFEENMDA